MEQKKAFYWTRDLRPDISIIKTGRILIAVLALAVSWPLFADNIPPDMYELLVGKYQLLGKMPDSDKTYLGELELKRTDDGLGVIRRINGEEVAGSARFETVSADNVSVLRMRFSEGGHDYEGTYLWSMDLDNYARMTGYIYQPGIATEDPGLEALFIKRN